MATYPFDLIYFVLHQLTFFD